MILWKGMQFSVDPTEWDSICSVIAKLSYVPRVDAFNEGKYLKFVTCFQSCAVLAVFLGLFFSPTPKLRLQMMQFELGLSKS